MKISYKAWIIFIILAILSIFVWYKLSYPQFSFIDLSVNKAQAMKIAQDFLKQKKIDTNSYLKSIIFVGDYDSDRYLQRSLGFRKEEDFIKENKLDMFFWIVRFFRQYEKEEYTIQISSATGQITGFQHSLEDIEKRQTLDKEIAKQMAKEFLMEAFKIDFSEYILHSEGETKFDNRTDYGFSWEKKDVYVLWDNKRESGGAKLLSAATVSGNEISSFYKSKLDIPEKFTRFIQRQMYMGRLIGSIFILIYVTLITCAIFVVIKRRNDLIMHLSKKYLIILGISFLILSITDAINEFQAIIFNYDTTSSLQSYLGNYAISFIINIIFISFALIMLGLAGETMRYEVYPNKKECSFFYFINSSFLNRAVAKKIMFGYIVFFTALGLQAVIFHLGQKYLGVWTEQLKLTKLSSSYLPFLGAFIIGFRASFSEEITFRMFGLAWLRKYLKKDVLAIVFISLIWGFGHSEYAIFPVWFRGIEVSLLGIFFAFNFLRYGIVPLIIAHYLFDAFWGLSGYIMGKSSMYLLLNSILILLLPSILAIIFYFINRRVEERRLEWFLNKHQQYNLEIITSFLSQNKERFSSPENLKQELVLHGWDLAVVELAIKKVYSS